MSNRIDSVMQETRRYWYDDGFAEIVIGLLFSAISAGLYLQYRVTDNPVLLMVVIIGMMVFIFASTAIVRMVLMRLKENVTYPRTGYVEYSEEPDPTARRIALVVPILVAVVILFTPERFNILGVSVGMIMGLFMAFVAYKSSVGRFTVAAVVAIGAGVMGGFLELNDIISTVFVFASVGIVLLITGAITLRSYLAQNPPLQD